MYDVIVERIDKSKFDVKLGFIFAFPLRGRGTIYGGRGACSGGTAEAVDEGNAISTYKRLSQLCIVYKHKEISTKIKEFFKTDACFHRLRSPHPSARLYLIFIVSFVCSHPPSPQWEGFC